MKKKELEAELAKYQWLYARAIEGGRTVLYDGWGGPRRKFQGPEEMDASLRKAYENQTK